MKFGQTIFVALDAKVFGSPTDDDTDAGLIAWAGCDLWFGVALFDDEEIITDLSNLAQITACLKAPDTSQPNSIPTPDDAVLCEFTTNSFAPTTESQWTGTPRQAMTTLYFTADQMKLAPGKYWLSFAIVTVDGHNLTAGAGWIVVQPNAFFPDATPPSPLPASYPEATSDGKYLTAIPANTNWRIYNGSVWQEFSPDTNLYYTPWVKIINGVPTVVYAAEGQS